MLHLYALVCLPGYLGFSTLRSRVLQHRSFASRMIRYLESIIVHSVDLDIGDGPSELAFIPPSAKKAGTDNEFHSRLSIDSNAVAFKKQVHSSNHNATYGVLEV